VTVTAAVELEVWDDALPGRHGPIPIRRYVPRGPEHPMPLVWAHGGAFSYGDLDMPESDAVARAIAGLGRTVIAVDYRRVPRWSYWRAPKPGTLPGVRFPVPVEDVVDAVDAIRAEFGAVMLGGASAGACLAAAATLHRARQGLPGPAGLVLAYGTLHAELPPISDELRARIRGRHGFAQFRPSTVLRMNRNYAGRPEAMDDEFAFPGGHDLHGMPRTLVIDADRDSLRASGGRFAAELRDASVATTYRVVEGSTHGFLNRPADPEFDRGIAEIGRWLAAT
jgi:xylan 1,4-beta-xylosidase